MEEPKQRNKHVDSKQAFRDEMEVKDPLASYKKTPETELTKPTMYHKIVTLALIAFYFVGLALSFQTHDLLMCSVICCLSLSISLILFQILCWRFEFSRHIPKKDLDSWSMGFFTMVAFYVIGASFMIMALCW